MAAWPTVGMQPRLPQGKWPVAGVVSTLRLIVDPCVLKEESHAIRKVRTALMESESGLRGVRLGFLHSEPVVCRRVVRLCIGGVGSAVCEDEARAGRCNGCRATTGQARARVSTQLTSPSGGVATFMVEQRRGRSVRQSARLVSS